MPETRDPALLDGKCGACEFIHVCSGCRPRAYYATGDYLAEEPFCAYEPRKLRTNGRRAHGKEAQGVS